MAFVSHPPRKISYDLPYLDYGQNCTLRFKIPPPYEKWSGRALRFKGLILLEETYCKSTIFYKA